MCVLVSLATVCRRLAMAVLAFRPSETCRTGIAKGLGMVGRDMLNRSFRESRRNPVPDMLDVGTVVLVVLVDSEFSDIRFNGSS